MKRAEKVEAVHELEGDLRRATVAVLGDRILPAAEVKALATLPSRDVLLAQLLGLLQAPATQLLRTLNEPAARLARLVDALAKRAGHGAQAPAGEPGE